MKHLTDAIKNAAVDTAHFMQRELRNSARAHNWDEEVVRNTHVHYTDGKFQVTVSPEHADAAFVHEYGDESSRPTAVIRKYGSANSAGKAFMSSVNSYLGGKK